MRVTGNTYTNNMLEQLNLLNSQQARLQNQAATGQRISAPSDDPAGMQQALNLQTDNSTMAQYAKTISTLQTRASASSDSLASLKTISDRVSEIATQVGGTTSPTAMKAYATEVTQLIQQAAQIVNTKSGDQYLFGGTASGQAPFTVATDANGNVTGVAYQGNSSVASNQIGDTTSLAVDVPGENNTGTGPRGLISDNRTGADFFNHLISLQNNLLANNSNAVTTTDLPALGKDEDNIIYHIANNGAAQSRLEIAGSIATTSQSSIQKSISDVAGADLAQTLTQLGQVQTAYQAALQSSASILQLRQSLLSVIP